MATEMIDLAPYKAATSSFNADFYEGEKGGLFNYVGKAVVWVRDAPHGYGEVLRDYAMLVRVLDDSRVLIRFWKDGRLVTRTVRRGSVLVPNIVVD